MHIWEKTRTELSARLLRFPAISSVINSRQFVCISWITKRKSTYRHDQIIFVSDNARLSLDMIEWYFDRIIIVVLMNIRNGCDE